MSHDRSSSTDTRLIVVHCGQVLASYAAPACCRCTCAGTSLLVELLQPHLVKPQGWPLAQIQLPSCSRSLPPSQ
jgi:hypothetical protein